MELAGVLIAVLLLIFLIYKRLSLIPATLICVAVLALTNGFSYMDLFINHYGVSLAGFVGKYFLVFVTNALFATVYKGNIIKNLIMDCQSYTKYRPNETTGGIFVSWRRKEELPTGA